MDLEIDKDEEGRSGHVGEVEQDKAMMERS